MDDRLERLISKIKTDMATAEHIDVLLKDDSFYDAYDLSLVLSHLKSSNSILNKDPAVVKKFEDKLFSLLGKSKRQLRQESIRSSFAEEPAVNTRRFDVPFPM